ncbi:hypothetical protein Syun_019152 [Stephania yunnanensis]|uniref:Uncharacterized protein n=1 Tax=Stephania yunnanensis TaxID=152371 RepID=A0AAP0IU96_9MAGN
MRRALTLYLSLQLSRSQVAIACPASASPTVRPHRLTRVRHPLPSALALASRHCMCYLTDCAASLLTASSSVSSPSPALAPASASQVQTITCVWQPLLPALALAGHHCLCCLTDPVQPHSFTASMPHASVQSAHHPLQLSRSPLPSPLSSRPQLCLSSQPHRASTTVSRAPLSTAARCMASQASAMLADHCRHPSPVRHNSTSPLASQFLARSAALPTHLSALNVNLSIPSPFTSNPCGAERREGGEGRRRGKDAERGARETRGERESRGREEGDGGENEGMKRAGRLEGDRFWTIGMGGSGLGVWVLVIFRRLRHFRFCGRDRPLWR